LSCHRPVTLERIALPASSHTMGWPP
jgi:hypothetical protein